MSDIREKLKPLLGKRVTVRGTFAKWEDHWMKNWSCPISIARLRPFL